MYIYTFIYLQYNLTAFLIFVGEVSTARQHGKQSIGQGNVHCCTPPSTRCTPQQSVNGLEMCLPPQTQTQSYNAILCTYLHVLLLISTLRMTSCCNIYIYIYIYVIHSLIQHSNIYCFSFQPGGVDVRMTTIGEQLSMAGYYCSVAGKWHGGGYLQSQVPTHRGFDTALTFLNGNEDHYTQYFGILEGMWLLQSGVYVLFVCIRVYVPQASKSCSCFFWFVFFLPDPYFTRGILMQALIYTRTVVLPSE